MHQIAEDVWQIPLMPRNGINAYLVGDVLVDAGIKQHASKVVGAVVGRGVRAHAITHAHYDHVGGTKGVIEALGVPFWCPANDAADAEAGKPTVADTWARPVVGRGGTWDPVSVDRHLQEGDELAAGFVVLDTPGHSPGAVSYWRERDRTLICGDVFFNLHILTLRYGIRHPPAVFTVDPARNRASQRKLADLRPEAVCFGHGPVLRDPAALARFAGS